MPKAALWTDDARLRVNARLAIPAAELTVRATRAGGPGGQHVNTASTRVEVTWSVAESPTLDEASRTLLRERLAARLDTRGTLRVVAADTRSQSQNRDLALARLADTVRRALVVPKKRRATKPSRAATEARIEAKKRRSSTKADRRKGWED